MDREKLQRLFDAYKTKFSVDINEYISGRTKLELPLVTAETMELILSQVLQLFKSEGNVLSLASPLIVIGDLHGQLLDLFRILHAYPDVSETKFLFLGDLIDRGFFSTETVTLVFIMKILYPENVFVIRGNHEFSEIFTTCGFSTELRKIYPNATALLERYERAFSFMPLAATIDNKILCVHGGIGPHIHNIDSIRCEKRPSTAFTPGAMDDVLWSDPDDRFTMYQPNKRGSGHCFGSEALTQFLQKNGLSMVIRGHQCVSEGVQTKWKGQLVTVFSASNYTGVTNNKGGIYKVNGPGQKDEIVRFDPIPRFTRENVTFRREGLYKSLDIPTTKSSHNPLVIESSRLPRINPGVFAKSTLTANRESARTKSIRSSISSTWEFSPKGSKTKKKIGMINLASTLAQLRKECL